MRVEERADGRFAVRFERALAHPATKVWRALTEPTHLRAWFVEILDYDRSRLAFAPDADLSFVATGDFPPGRGRVLTYDPPRLLEYTWDTEILRFELIPDGDTACVLRFTNIVDGRGTADAVAPGWNTGLDRLATHLSTAASRR
jgi:uncharacterized protein YndB with AHSA1/START domain